MSRGISILAKYSPLATVPVGNWIATTDAKPGDEISVRISDYMPHSSGWSNADYKIVISDGREIFYPDLPSYEAVARWCAMAKAIANLLNSKFPNVPPEQLPEPQGAPRD